MRRILPLLLLSVLLGTLVTARAGASANPAPESTATPRPAAAAQAATTERYFGRDPFNAVLAAATSANRTCSAPPRTISAEGLAALVLAPVFKESSAATTADSAPSPMTLSRYDEWTGTYSTSTNSDANYGLYAFRNPYTSYLRAYWHPGIGIWQYDSAGVGAPFTAIERMNVNVVAPDAAAGMVARYCNPSESVVGHPPPYTDQERSYSAWAPWGYPCTLCQGFFAEMTSTSPKFANLNLVDGISVTGGAQSRQCLLGDSPTPVTCWYIDPSVGTIQGSTAWATLSPDGGSGPTVAPAPLSRPFYVVDRGATEERHWLGADTGYGINISAVRQIGQNARPRTGQSGSGLTWRSTSDLCDITAGRGNCEALPPSPKRWKTLSVGGTYTPVVGDFEADGRDEVIWYGAGAASDYLWNWSGSSFVSTPLSIGGTYTPIVGDFEADGRDEVIWYGAGAAKDYVWNWSGSSFVSTPLSIGGTYTPIVGDFDADGRDEVIWYGAGAAKDYVWNWSGSSFVSTPLSIGGTYTPVVGDWDADGRDEVIWYGAGSTPDYLWNWSGSSFVSTPLSIGGTYTPVVGDFEADGRDEVIWYGAGSASDYLWNWSGSGFVSTPLSIGGTYRPVVSDLFGTGRADIIWYSAGPGSDYRWNWSAEGFSSSNLVMDGSYVPVQGNLDGTAGDDVLWYSPGSAIDPLWYG